MTVSAAASRFAQVRSCEGQIDPAHLSAIWDELPRADAAELMGTWSGFAFSTGHPVERLLTKSRWYGKRFLAMDNVQPMLCRDERGELFSDVAAGKGEASLWNIEFRGVVTASMVYDGQAVVDHFKRVDDNTLMGVMNGKASWVMADGQHFWFGLERTADDVTVSGRADDLIKEEDR